MFGDAMSTFAPYSSLHAIVVGAVAVVIAIVCILGRQMRSAGNDSRLRHAIGAAGIAVLLAHQAYWVVPANFTWTRSLPLHLCDLAGLVAPIAMIAQPRWARTLLYYWAVCLCSQGFITPVLTEGPGTLVFWFFFGSHAVIIGSAAYDVFVGGYRPAWRDFGVACLLTLGYLAAVFVLDLLTGWNYGYAGVGNTSQPTAVDLLGPWPWRVLGMCGVGVAAFALATAPWTIAGRAGEGFPEK